MITKSLGKFSRQHIYDSFRIFPRKHDLILHSKVSCCMKCQKKKKKKKKKIIKSFQYDVL